MCGISGIIDFKKKSNLDKLSTYLISQQNHRGPDACNSWIDIESGVSLCHNRLSIIDISNNGSQPMQSYCGRYLISYNGEIYNYSDLKKKLSNKKIDFKGDSDTEVLINSISVLGLQKTLQYINGMFAFALWDKREKKLILCRDRFGQKPIYYSLKNNYFLFSSELKTIKNFFKNELELNKESVYYFHKYGYIKQPSTIYKDVFKLESSSFIEITLENVKKNIISQPKLYWDIRKEINLISKNKFKNFTEAKIEIKDQLDRSVRECMVSDVPIGSFLSGGLDSSLVSYYMQKNSIQKINTFSIGNLDTDYDESKDSKNTAKFLNSNHNEFFLNKNDIIEISENIPYIYDEPFADSSQIPTIYLSRKTSSTVKVVLTGDGGDEMFGGYNRYIFSNKINFFLNNIPSYLRTQIKKIFYILPINIKLFIIRIISSEKNLKLVEIKISKILLLLSSKNKKVAYDQLCSQININENIFKNHNYNFNNYSYFNNWPDVDSYLNEMIILDTENYLNGDILVKLDRGSMNSSLEARSPLLSNYLFNSAWKLEDEYKVNKKFGKIILRSISEDIFPKNFLTRPKIGFGLPIGKYLKTYLKEWANDLIFSNTLQNDEFLKPIEVEKIWNNHIESKNDKSFMLWNILNYLSWKRKIHD